MVREYEVSGNFTCRVVARDENEAKRLAILLLRSANLGGVPIMVEEVQDDIQDYHTRSAGPKRSA